MATALEIPRAEDVPDSMTIPAPPDIRMQLMGGRTYVMQVARATRPPRYRSKISAHHPWTPRDQRRFERFARVVRATVPRLPAQWQIEPAARRFFAEHPRAS